MGTEAGIRKRLKDVMRERAAAEFDRLNPNLHVQTYYPSPRKPAKVRQSKRNWVEHEQALYDRWLMGRWGRKLASRRPDDLMLTDIRYWQARRCEVNPYDFAEWSWFITLAADSIYTLARLTSQCKDRPIHHRRKK